MEVKLYENNPFPDEYIIDLVQEVYSREIDLNYWKWRFHNNPLEDKTNIAYIEQKGKLISFYSVSESRFVDGSRLHRCGLMKSAMTRPGFTGRGFIAQLEVFLHNHLFANKGYSFVYGFANHQSHRIHRKHCNWKDLFVLNSFSASSEDIQRKSNHLCPCTFSISKAVDYDFTAIELLLVGSVQYGFSRQVDIVKWRLQDPRNIYMVMELRAEDGSIICVLFFKEYLNGIDIMDYFVAEDSVNDLFIAKALSILSQNTNRVNIWSNVHSEEHLMLERLGFQEREFNAYFGQISNTYVLDEKLVRYRFMDSDVY
jgi:hypothetical protein